MRESNDGIIAIILILCIVAILIAIAATFAITYTYMSKNNINVVEKQVVGHNNHREQPIQPEYNDMPYRRRPTYQQGSHYISEMY